MLYTVGHSTLQSSDFLTMLGGEVSVVLDVRSHPMSRWEQFQKEKMESWLPEHGVKYEWHPELGGWDTRHFHLRKEMRKHGVDLGAYAGGKFPKQRIALGSKEPTPNETNQETLSFYRPSWTNVGLMDYSWFMTLDEFLAGADDLIARSTKENVAFLCAECQWWRCHRSMIADYLSFRNVESYHIMPHLRQKNKIKFVDGHKITPHSQVLGNRLDRYDPEILSKWSAWKTAEVQR